MTPTAKGALRCALGLAAAASLGAALHAQDDQARMKEEALNERLRAIEDKLNSPDVFKVQWKDGLRLTTNDNRLDLKIGGRVHFEGQWNHSEEDLEQSSRFNGAAGDTANLSKLGPLEDGFETRRARLYLSGTMYSHVEFKFQFDLAKGGTAQKDVYAGFYNLGDWVPNFRAGQQYEPFGLDALESSNDSQFIERANISNVFAPNRNVGLLLWKNFKDDNNVERVTWAAGLFRNDSGDNGVGTASSSKSGDGGYSLTGRVTATPWWENDGRHMFEIGVAGSRRSVPGRGNSTVTFASNPEADTLPALISTGAIAEADVDWRYGLESMFIFNKWSAQGEYMLTQLDTGPKATRKNPGFSGYYAQVGYTLTGEARRWKPVEAIPQNPKPYANAFENGGMGAWELALRYSNIDLTDGNATTGVQGGSIDEITVGLNWYVNPNARVMLDVSRADVNVDNSLLGKGGVANIVQMRVQFNF